MEELILTLIEGCCQYKAFRSSPRCVTIEADCSDPNNFNQLCQEYRKIHECLKEAGYRFLTCNLTVGVRVECETEEHRTARLAKARARRRGISAAMASVGVKRVRGALGGTYWE
jgi:hypothetical protein